MSLFVRRTDAGHICPGASVSGDVVRVMILMVAALFPGDLIAKKSRLFRNLKSSDVRYRMVAPVHDIKGMLLENNHLYALYDGRPWMIRVVFDGKKPIDKAFATLQGRVADGKRIALPVKKPGNWVGATGFVNNSLLLLSDRGRVLALDREKFAYISIGDVILDRAAPALDTRGSPIKLEIRRFRAAFMRALDRVPETRKLMTGLAVLPKEWRQGEPHQFLLTGTMPGYPLMTMHCSEEIKSNCRVRRTCFVRGDTPKDAGDRLGIAVSRKRRLVLIGDRAAGRIFVYRFRSCYDVVFKQRLYLPERLGRLAGMMVDDQDRLWVSTTKPDQWTNASVYVWESPHW